MWASVSDWATASLPEIGSSLSSSVAAGAAGVTTAIAGLRLIARLGRRDPSPATSGGSHYLDRLVLRVLARDAGGDLDTPAVEGFFEFLLVLAAGAEAVRAHGGGFCARLLRHPGPVLVPFGPPHIPLALFLRLADRDRRDGHALPHLPPLGHLERIRDLDVALGQLDFAGLEPLVCLLRRLDLEVRAPLDLLDGLAHPIERQEGRGDLGEGAQDPDLGVILFVDPEPGERGLRAEERQLVGRVFLVDVLQ